MHTTQVRLMASYNRWMNERLYTACSQMSDMERKWDRKVFFGSIHGTLNHLLLGDKIWLGRFEGKPFAVTSLDQELYTDFDELQKERIGTDAHIENWAADLTDDVLAGELHFTSVVNLIQRSYDMWVTVTHFFNHQTHHRGQLTTLLSQCGRNYGVTDLIWLPELMPEEKG